MFAHLRDVELECMKGRSGLHCHSKETYHPFISMQHITLLKGADLWHVLLLDIVHRYIRIS